MSRDGEDWDRFARWPPPLARIALLALMLMIAAAALVPIHGAHPVRTRTFLEQVRGTGPRLPARPRDADLALYDRAIARIRHGERYYDFIVAEQRRSHYPVRPAVAVRLPTLAYLDAWLGDRGQIVAAVALLLTVLIAWWRRLGDEPGGREHRPVAMALVFFGASLGLNTYYFVLHELWSGMLLALSFGLHRAPQNTPDGRGRWLGALAAAALALAIREHALPYVLLMAAFALARRRWREGAAWSALAAAFGLALTLHFHAVAAQVLPTDRPSAPWLAMRGLSGWLSNIVLASNLRYFLRPIGGVVVIAAMLGWAGWRSPAGLFGFWLFAGYGVLFMLVGRWDNFYWGALIAPAMFTGLAFAPRALASLLRAARGGALAPPGGAVHKPRRWPLRASSW